MCFLLAFFRETDSFIDFFFLTNACLGWFKVLQQSIERDSFFNLVLRGISLPHVKETQANLQTTKKKEPNLREKKGKQTEYTEQSNLIAKIAMKTVLTSTTAVTPEFLTQNRSAATPLTKA